MCAVTELPVIRTGSEEDTPTQAKLFISFSGLVRLLELGITTTTELRYGLFYFGSTRQRVVEDSVGELVSQFWGVNPEARERGSQIILDIRQEILLAEHEGRIRWRGHPYAKYEVLNELLMTHGFPPVAPRADGYFGSESYPYIKEELQRSKAKIEVVF